MSAKDNLIAALEQLEAEGRAEIPAAASKAELEALRIKYLGRKEGKLTAILRALGSLSTEDKPAVGAVSNRVKTVISELLEAREASLGEATSGFAYDLTMPGRRSWQEIGRASCRERV